MPQQHSKQEGWTFIGEQGEFRLEQPNETSFLYFPLANEAGMLSAISPALHGDIKSSYYSFLTPPVSSDDLHNSKSSRNFWIYVDGKGAWSASGNSAKQNAALFGDQAEKVTLEAGFLWHRVKRENISLGISSEIINFVPTQLEKVELMQIKITNIGNEKLQITPTASVPLYGRSAEALRDHRHVTSLLNRVYTLEYGIELQPALSFDERGHQINKTSFSILGCEGEAIKPEGYFPILEDFIGEGGSLDWPEKIVRNSPSQSSEGLMYEGFEAVGAIRFRQMELLPGQSKTYTIAMVITEDRINEPFFLAKYVSESKFAEHLNGNIQFWLKKINAVMLQSGDRAHDKWMKWVGLQPILRRVYGNSFLPYHDYGRGGRGWRDLWQDCLALLITEPTEMRHLLLNNFAGVRIDGSNATIIGSKAGEFIADRNNIPRVWMDHGAWPFFTTLFYINQTGDLNFLLQKQGYFKDSHHKRCKAKDMEWNEDEGNRLKTNQGEIYQGTILEHLLLQNMVPFLNVGAHNNIKLEGADWNDGLDLASDKGESVAFTAFYATNLSEMSRILLNLQHTLGINQIDIAEEMAILFDTADNPINYDSVTEKLVLLERFFDSCLNTISGKKISLSIPQAVEDLARKANWLVSHLRTNEWIQNAEGYAWFNGYYNNEGNRVEGDNPFGVRMTLTGQVFTIMGGTATNEQVAKICESVNMYLKDDDIGYRLNTRFGSIQQDLGRAFGFAYGHKENGAMFSHMTVMYANALYKRGFVKEGHAVLASIYNLSTTFERSRMYPGIPEYINEKGRGMYTYLTGSASWLLLTMVTEVYGVKGKMGDLLLEPKLLKPQFDADGQSSIVTTFAGVKLNIVYTNKGKLDYNQYTIDHITLNGIAVVYDNLERSCLIHRTLLTSLRKDKTHTIEVTLQ